MSDASEEDRTVYQVLVNDEEQYSLWPKDNRTLPRGWRATGKEGTRAECSRYVDEVWIDMRPLSLRRRMGGA